MGGKWESEERVFWNFYKGLKGKEINSVSLRTKRGLCLKRKANTPPPRHYQTWSGNPWCISRSDHSNSVPKPTVQIHGLQEYNSQGQTFPALHLESILGQHSIWL